MFPLNLPSIEANLKNEGKKSFIFDPLRRRYVALTPEEWVRQHFVSFLTNHRGYPAPLIANEISISLNGMSRRCDSVVYDRKLTPVAIVEYKAPHVTISKQTFSQANAYNQVLRVPYIIISNGLSHYCCRIDYAKQTCEFLSDIPFYKDLEQNS